MDEKLLQEFIQFLGNQLKAKDLKDLENKVKNLSKEDLKKYYDAFVEFKKNQKVKAAFGAKLNYFKALKNDCAEDEELVIFKSGGKVGCGCKKLEEGGKPKKKITPIDEFKGRDEAAKDSILANKYNDLEVQVNKPGSYKKDKNGKVIWVPDRTKAPYNKIKKDCGGSAIIKSFKAKCGTKMKKHQLGGILNGIPFYLKGTNKNGIIYEIRKPYMFDNDEYLDIESRPDKFGRKIVLTRQVRPRNDGTLNNDTTYLAFIHNKNGGVSGSGFNYIDRYGNESEGITPKKALNRPFNTWGDYFKYLLSLRKNKN